VFDAIAFRDVVATEKKTGTLSSKLEREECQSDLAAILWK
jgi:hypothetical protein